MNYCVPVGVVFTDAVVRGFLQRFPNPLDLGRVRIVTNSGRFAATLNQAFAETATIAPKIYAWQAFLDEEAGRGAEPRARVHHVLEIARLVKSFATQMPELINDNSIYEIAYLLIELLDQASERGLDPEDFVNFDAGIYAEHWQRNALFFRIIAQYWREAALDVETREAARQIERLNTRWQQAVAVDPVFIVGSTGSRVVMRDLMKAAINHKLGGIILPAYDLERPEDLTPEHPQFGFQDLEQALDLPRAVLWNTDDTIGQSFLRASLAPAPATDEWLTRAAQLRADIASHPIPLTVIAAETPLDEVRALAAAIYDKRSQGKTVAIVSPDRALIRRLTVRLEALGIAFEDSAGLQMALTPSGGFAGLYLDAVIRSDAVSVMAFLSHPFTARMEGRRAHLAHLRWLDQRILREYSGTRFWEIAREHDEAAEHSAWLAQWSAAFDRPVPQTLGAWLSWHREALAGASGVIEGNWTVLGGAERGDLALFEALDALIGRVFDPTPITMAEYQRFWRAWISRERAVVRAQGGDPRVKILGQIEARTETADCVILTSVNEGHWPDAEIPDMWLNRDIRRKFGLETPERFVGLSAHDFVGAFSASEVVLSRSINQDGAPTVESRFLTRLRVLWAGFDPDGWAKVMARGAEYISHGQTLDAPETIIAPSPRPAIALPAKLRPSELSVTGIERMVKNPYDFYVRNILRLRPLNALGADLDAAATGKMIHDVMQKIHETHETNQVHDRGFYDLQARELLSDVKIGPFEVLSTQNILEKFFDDFVPIDQNYSEWAETINVETTISATFSGAISDVAATVSARVDRIDIGQDGQWRLFDYKSGSAAPYTNKKFKPEQALQLPVTALIVYAQYGGTLDKCEVIRYKNTDSHVITPLFEYDLDAFYDQFVTFLDHIYSDNYTYRAMPADADFDRAIAQFSRYGEWRESDEFEVIEVHDD